MKVLVLASGGLDSAVALFWAVRRFGAPNVSILAFDYAGRPRGERRSLARLTRAAWMPRAMTVRLPLVGPTRADGAPDGYIPAKNAVFYAFALAVAEREGIPVIVGGHTRDDGALYRDARASFFRQMNLLARAGRPSRERPAPRFVMPLIRLRGRQVLALARRLAVPIGATWSCQRDVPRPCGQCGSCRIRLKALCGNNFCV